MRMKKLVEYENEKVLCEMESRMEKSMLCEIELEMEMWIGKRSEVERILKVKIGEEWEDEFERIFVVWIDNVFYVVSGYDIMELIMKEVEK